MSDVYDNPKYYEIAFAFRDIPREVDLFEECARRYARLPVSSFLELGCGNSPHMPELVRRGYSYTGLDTNESMLAYSRSKIPPKANVTLIKADMCNFTTDHPAQFAFVALGSLFAPSTTDLMKHFRCVAMAVQSGGLYLLDWCVQFSPIGGSETWKSRRDDVVVETAVSWRTIDQVEQLAEETIALNVKDGDASTICTTSRTFRAMFPQEFLLLVRHCTGFEFVGWWNDWNLDEPLRAGIKISRPIVLLRRK